MSNGPVVYVRPQDWFYLFIVSQVVHAPDKPNQIVPLPWDSWWRWHHGYLLNGQTPYQPPGEALNIVRGYLPA